MPPIMNKDETANPKHPNFCLIPHWPKFPQAFLSTKLPNQRDPNQFFFETFREPQRTSENLQRTFREPSENLQRTSENLQRTFREPFLFIFSRGEPSENPRGNPGTRFRELCGTDAGAQQPAISIRKVRTPSV